MLTYDTIFRVYGGVALLALGAGMATLGAVFGNDSAVAFGIPFLGQGLFLAGLLVVIASLGWLAALESPASRG